MSTDQNFFDGRIVLKPGDCREQIKTIADNSIDAICTDPPYALESIVKRFGADNAAPATPKEGSAGAYARASRGFMNQIWDTGGVAFSPEFWRECLRVLKPGGHLIAFSGDRTYHHMATAIDAAGFEIRHSLLNVIASDTAVSKFMDSLSEEQTRAFLRCIEESEFGGMMAYCYGSGFPKAHDVAKGIDRMLGVDREVVGTETLVNDMRNSRHQKAGRNGEGATPYEREVTVATSELAKAWTGWKSALKPAFEPICLARKPLEESSIAANVVKHGVGALNIDGCRIDAEKVTGWGGSAGGSRERVCTPGNKDGAPRPVQGRFPANVITDGSEEVFNAFPDTGGAQSAVTGAEPSPASDGTVTGKRERVASAAPRNDTGSAARFYYAPKADGDDRLGSNHPTIKNQDLIRYLVRLITPKGGTVLDPFAGTGTTGAAAYWEGCNAILIEREPTYQADIAKRMGLILAGPDARKRARTKLETLEGLPLFSSL